MIDDGKRNILEEKTAQDVADSIREAMCRLNDGNLMTTFCFLKRLEGSIGTVLYNIMGVRAFGKSPNCARTMNLFFPRITESQKIEEVGKIKKRQYKLSDCIRAERNWKKVLELLKDYFVIVECAIRKKNIEEHTAVHLVNTLK